MVESLCGAKPDPIWYLGPQAPVSEINKLELFYGTLASFDISMHNFYKLPQGKTEKMTQLEGALNAAQQNTLQCWVGARFKNT